MRVADELRGYHEFGNLNVRQWKSHAPPKLDSVYHMLLSHVPPCHPREYACACIYTNDGHTRWYKTHLADYFQPDLQPGDRWWAKHLRRMKRQCTVTTIAVPHVDFSTLVYIGRRVALDEKYRWDGY
jgi:hypothetical protein